MAEVVTTTQAPRRATASLVEDWGRALDAHGQAARTGTERTRDEAVAVLEKARDQLIARVQELERDRDLLERLARMDSITLGSRVGSPLRKWEAPRLQRSDAIRQWLATLPEVPR